MKKASLIEQEAILMEYRTLPRTGEKISVIGMGTAYIGEQSIDDIVSVTEKALDYGINYFDLAAGHRPAIEGIGKAIRNRREDVFLQMSDKKKNPETLPSQGYFGGGHGGKTVSITASVRSLLLLTHYRLLIF